MEKYINAFKEANSRGLLDFSPSDITLGKDNYSCAQLVDMLKNDEINLETLYQRKEGLWEVRTKSRFIESMMLKFPIPPLYFNVIYKDKKQTIPHWEVIDGLQRLSTIKEFILGIKGKKLVLDGMDFYPEINGLTYENLPRHLIRNFESCQLQLHLVYPNTPKQVIRRIFERINTTNLKLTDQEIRNAIYQGEVIEMLKKSSAILSLYNIKTNDKRMAPQELVLRFYSFFCFGTDFYPKENNLGLFLDQSIRGLNELNTDELMLLHSTFEDSIQFCHKTFGIDCFKSSGGRFNRSLFETLMVFVAKLNESQRKKIFSQRKKALDNFFSLIKQERFIKSISSATSRSDNVKYRFNAINEIGKNIL
ncbi:DUF262 domain-containing protein [Pantoea agglomerans]|uniref:DUF262 domain-containing protein n=1 Tax=Enterobacter agglomerans TaxID=549 RepID=UPI002A6ACA75|nr:DUF262 domain-containing protein [Pantoea agglomerans]MDY0996028.1 DUF262 domain-containing protein [Pantoea agglomerans]